jgi:hypothetical protein
MVFQKRALQWYSKCYCVASVTYKLFIIQGVEEWIVCTPLNVNILVMYDYTLLNVFGTGIPHEALSSVSCSCDNSASSKIDTSQVWPFTRTSCEYFAHG